MINKRLTCKRRLEHYNPGEETTVICIPANEVFIRESANPLFDFLAGEVADKLYAYEELGYEPEELRVILADYRECCELLANHTNCNLKTKPVIRQKRRDSLVIIANRIINESMEKGDRSVTVTLGPDDYITVSVYPLTEDEKC